MNHPDRKFSVLARPRRGFGRTGTILLLATIALAAGAVIWLRSERSQNTSAAPAAAVYVCPMHPWIKSDTPAKCTLCGMSLVARAPTDAASMEQPAGTIRLGASQVTTVGVATEAAAVRPLQRTLRVTGRIDDNDNTHRIISARVPGRIEKLHIRNVGEKIVATETVATIYSPEMLTAQREFVERIRIGPAAVPIASLAAARERLQLLGLTDEDIATLESRREPSALVAVRSPVEGNVVAKFVYEGQYVQASDRLFEVADFSTMWFLFDAYAQDLPWLGVGLKVDVTSEAFGGEKMTEIIEFIDPNFDPVTRTAKVRVVIQEPHFIIGDQHIFPSHRVPAQGVVHLAAPEVLSIPKSAVLDSGAGPVVYVDIGMNVYEQRRPVLGRRGDTHVEVILGLNAGDKVVTRGALLLDSQAQLTRESAPDPMAALRPTPVPAADPAPASGGATP